MDDKLTIPSSRLVVGMIAIILGVLFTLDNLGVIEVGNYMRFWPLALVAFGMAVFLESEKVAGRFAGGIVVLAGGLLLLNNIGIIRFRIWHFWPVVLILLGISIIWRGYERARLADSDPSSTISTIAILGGFEKTCSSLNFRGGEITAIMGGCEIDLSQADIPAGEAVIQIFAMWGGVDLKVPEDWVVTVRVIPFMGGVDQKARVPVAGSRKNLIVKGFAIMGGVEIHN